eukprot:TRINITY_DN1516_c0_g1_i1.p2 TRINITY_DN1516_c0_g1~~TRINITY_DN1516_c0_g1_i1.p2  ORF type:complete len:192 (+),score=0.03 TRINITY_DN1516_c0_g1_i1:186-761(+)
MERITFQNPTPTGAAPGASYPPAAPPQLAPGVIHIGGQPYILVPMPAMGTGLGHTPPPLVPAFPPQPNFFAPPDVRPSRATAPAPPRGSHGVQPPVRASQSLVDFPRVTSTGHSTIPSRSLPDLNLQVRGPPQGPLVVTVPGAALPPKILQTAAANTGRVSRALPTYTYDYGAEMDSTVLDILRKSVQNGR